MDLVNIFIRSAFVDNMISLMKNLTIFQSKNKCVCILYTHVCDTTARRAPYGYRRGAGCSAREGEGEDAVSAVAVSNNGYHIAAGYASSTLRFWDLRKQKVVASLDKQLDSISTVAFDKAGKYAAFGGAGGLKITTIKEWGTTASLETKKPVSGIVWSSKSSNYACTYGDSDT